MSDPIETLNRLFDTLKEASNRNEKSTQRLIDQQMELVTHIKTMPIEQLRTALKEHHEKSSKDMDDCSGTIELKSGDIMSLLRIINAKITKMFIIVSITIAVSTGGYFLIKYAAEHDEHPPVDWQSKYEKIEKEQQDMIDSKLEKLMKDVRDEIKRLHPPTKENGDKKDESVHK